jgi:hypothetical protein
MIAFWARAWHGYDRKLRGVALPGDEIPLPGLPAEAHRQGGRNVGLHRRCAEPSRAQEGARGRSRMEDP